MSLDSLFGGRATNLDYAIKMAESSLGKIVGKTNTKMKSVVEKEEENIKFPILMEFVNHSPKFIVLFSQPNCGMVVSSENSTHNLGSYRTDWRMELFNPFKGKVTLFN